MATASYYVLTYELAGDYLERRPPLRAAHLGLARAAHERGELVLAGALSEPADRALLIFRVPDPAVVESFAREDPYVKNGLITHWEVRPWTVVIGGQDALPG